MSKKEEFILRARCTEEEFNMAIRLGRGNMSLGMRKALVAAAEDEERIRKLDSALDALRKAAQLIEELRVK